MAAAVALTDADFSPDEVAHPVLSDADFTPDEVIVPKSTQPVARQEQQPTASKPATIGEQFSNLRRGIVAGAESMVAGAFHFLGGGNTDPFEDYTPEQRGSLYNQKRDELAAIDKQRTEIIKTGETQQWRELGQQRNKIEEHVRWLARTPGEVDKFSKSPTAKTAEFFSGVGDEAAEIVSKQRGQVVDPASMASKIVTGLGEAIPMFATASIGGLPMMIGSATTGMFEGGYQKAYQEAVGKGVPDSEARAQASDAGLAETFKRSPDLAVYAVTGKLGGELTNVLFRSNAYPMAKTAISVALSALTNIGTSAGIAEARGEEYDLSQIPVDILFALPTAPNIHREIVRRENAAIRATADADSPTPATDDAMRATDAALAQLQTAKAASAEPVPVEGKLAEPPLSPPTDAGTPTLTGEVKLPAGGDVASTRANVADVGVPDPSTIYGLRDMTERTGKPIDTSKPEQILAPAIRTSDGSVAVGSIHAEAVGMLPEGTNVAGETDLFLTTHGRLVGRAEAGVIKGITGKLHATTERAAAKPTTEPTNAKTENQDLPTVPPQGERVQLPETPVEQIKPVDAPVPAKPVEQAEPELAAPVIDVRKSPYALGFMPENKAVQWVTKNAKRLFTATGDLPKQTFEKWIERNGFVKSESRQTAYAARDLYAGLKTEFGISTTEQLTKGFAKVPPEFVKKMNSALLGEVDINTLPETVRAPLQKMRDHIDALSQRMLDEGVIPESLRAKVADNLGVYMTRSYRVFDDPAWAEKIPQEIRNRTRDFILSNLQRENPSATPENARAVMDSMLQDWRDQGTGALVKSGGKIGSKDLTSFIARKDIPKVLREFMGEYSDPLVSYARSVTKAANLIGSQRFLNSVRQEGLGKFIFEDGQQPATHSALIAAEGSDVMAPLNGLRTTPEIAAAFKEFGKSDVIKNGFIRAMLGLSGAAKTAKTVGSVMTQARNILGQTYFFAMNGHFDMRPAQGAVKAVLADLGATSSTESRAAYQRYLKLGLVDQSVKASELRDIIRDAGLNDPGMQLENPGKLWARTARKLTYDAAAKMYQVSDDLGKIIGFENELTRQREIHPDWTMERAEVETAERIRNTYPTYSMVPEAVKQVRRVPVIAPFISFASETFRTTYHNLRYTVEDLQSSNPAQKKAGAQRLAGQIAVVASGYTLSAVSRAMLGMNAQDEDDARRFMAPWDKDSQIMFTGKKDGEAKFVNLSYVNPYSYLSDPVISVASGLKSADELGDIMVRAFAKLVQPFTSEDIAAGSLIDIARNTTKTGQRVFNPGDTIWKQLEDKIGHVAKTVEPGTLSRVRGKIIPAIKGETDKTGRKPELSNEILSELTGFKTQTIDYKQAIGFRASAFRKSDEDADAIFRDTAGRRGAVDPSEVVDSYKRATRSKFETWQEMYRDIQAAKRRGLSDSDVLTAIKARGLTNSDANSLLEGNFAPYKVSKALSKQLKDNGRTLPPEVETEKARTEKLVLSGKFEP